MLVDYTALRSIKSGHVVDTVYQIDLALSRRDRRYPTVGTRSVAISGGTVQVVNRRDTIYALQSIIITDTSTPDNADLLEFLDSVSSGETFLSDVSGNPEIYIIESTTLPYRATRVGTLENFRYSFTVRQI